MSVETDYGFMSAAIGSAREGLQKGNLPVGAVLAIDGNLVDMAHNSNFTNGDLNSHAESTIIARQSRAIYATRETSKTTLVELFTTWEPCLMCLGTSVLNRVNRIVYACPDPRGGTSKLLPESIGVGYEKIWPEIIIDTRFREQSYELLVGYMTSQAPRWETMLAEMRKMREFWT